MDPSIHLFHLASFQNVTEKQKACETDLAKAEPAPRVAQEAFDTPQGGRQEEEEEESGPRTSELRGDAMGSLPGPPCSRLRAESPLRSTHLSLQNNLTELKSFGSSRMPWLMSRLL